MLNWVRERKQIINHSWSLHKEKDWCANGVGGGPQWYHSSDYDFYGESGDSTQYHAIPWKYHTTTSTTTVQHLTFILHIWCYYALSNTMHYYEASPAIFLNVKNQVKLACCPVLLAPSIEDPGVAVNETPSSWISCQFRHHPCWSDKPLFL